MARLILGDRSRHDEHSSGRRRGAPTTAYCASRPGVATSLRVNATIAFHAGNRADVVHVVTSGVDWPAVTASVATGVAIVAGTFGRSGSPGVLIVPGPATSE